MFPYLWKRLGLFRNAGTFSLTHTELKVLDVEHWIFHTQKNPYRVTVQVTDSVEATFSKTSARTGAPKIKKTTVYTCLQK